MYRSLSQELLEWFDSKKRDLPWRSTRDPYRIWVSEIMLQQTQVRTVLRYYEEFMARFATVEDLAKASLDEVLASWSGLGYYRRARQMHETAQRIVADFAAFPSSSRELQMLPGIGAYTAAAVASIAFGEQIVVLDGNVERVLCRRLGLDQHPKQSAVRRKLVKAAEKLLVADRPGDSNQALMELGARICRPRLPDCEGCPLRRDCIARLRGDPGRYPAPRRRKKTERIHLVVAVARQDGRVLMFRRSKSSSFLAGMWELPNVERRTEMPIVEQALAQRYGGFWFLKGETDRIRHNITHRVFSLHVHSARFESRESLRGAVWVSDTERTRLPKSSIVEKVLAGGARC